MARVTVQEPCPVYDQTGQNTVKIDTLFMPKTPEKPYLLGPHIPTWPK